MFIEAKKVITYKSDPLTKEDLMKKEETIFLFEGQSPNENNTNIETQNYYRKLFRIQEEASLTAGRPVCIFEALKIGL